MRDISFKKTSAFDSSGNIINPSTEEKQDDTITKLGDIETNQTDGSQKTKIVDVNNVNATGEVQATPTSNTILGRLKAIWDRLSDATQKTMIVDGSGNVIGSLGNALNIHDADVHTILVNRHFIDFDSATENPSVAIVAGDIVILVADTTGFVTNGAMVINDAGGDVREHHFKIISVVANTSITVDRPIDKDYTTSATLEVVTHNLNVDGSGASVSYIVQPPSDETWHITRIIIAMSDDATMDDTKFGSLVALTNGVAVREVKSTGNETLTIWRTNAHIAEDMYDVSYPSKVPAGVYSLRGRWTLTNAGVVSKLDGSAGDYLEVLIQDDLTDMSTFNMKAQGHIEGI